MRLKVGSGIFFMVLVVSLLLLFCTGLIFTWTSHWVSEASSRGMLIVGVAGDTSINHGGTLESPLYLDFGNVKPSLSPYIVPRAFQITCTGGEGTTQITIQGDDLKPEATVETSRVHPIKVKTIPGTRLAWRITGDLSWTPLTKYPNPVFFIKAGGKCNISLDFKYEVLWEDPVGKYSGPVTISFSPLAEEALSKAYPNPFSPNGDGIKDIIVISSMSAWDTDNSSVPECLITFDNDNPKIIKRLKTKPVNQGAYFECIWDGTDETGSVVPDGRYRYSFRKPNQTYGAAEGIIIVDTIPPELMVHPLENAGEIQPEITVEGRTESGECLVFALIRDSVVSEIRPDPDGTFSFRISVPPGTPELSIVSQDPAGNKSFYHMVISAADKSDWTVEPKEPVTVRHTSPETKGGIIGQAIDKKTGMPLPNVKVSLLSPEGNLIKALDTGGNGRFRFDRIPSGLYMIVAECLNYCDYRTNLIRVDKGRETLLEFSLIPNDALSIRKIVSAETCSIGDIVEFTLSIKNTTGRGVNDVKIYDVIPRGITLVPCTSRVSGKLVEPKVIPNGKDNGSYIQNIASWSIETLGPYETLIITFKAVIGFWNQGSHKFNSRQGVIRNIAYVEGKTGLGKIRTPASEADLNISEGVFKGDGVIFGRVFMDTGEPGILGDPLSDAVLTVSDGTQIPTDSKGMYIIKNLRPGYYMIGLSSQSIPPGFRCDPGRKLIYVRHHSIVRLDFPLIPEDPISEPLKRDVLAGPGKSMVTLGAGGVSLSSMGVSGDLSLFLFGRTEKGLSLTCGFNTALYNKELSGDFHSEPFSLEYNNKPETAKRLPYAGPLYLRLKGDNWEASVSEFRTDFIKSDFDLCEPVLSGGKIQYATDKVKIVYFSSLPPIAGGSILGGTIEGKVSPRLTLGGGVIKYPSDFDVAYLRTVYGKYVDNKGLEISSKIMVSQKKDPENISLGGFGSTALLLACKKERSPVIFNAKCEISGPNFWIPAKDVKTNTLNLSLKTRLTPTLDLLSGIGLYGKAHVTYDNVVPVKGRPGILEAGYTLSTSYDLGSSGRIIVDRKNKTVITGLDTETSKGHVLTSNNSLGVRINKQFKSGTYGNFGIRWGRKEDYSGDMRGARTLYSQVEAEVKHMINKGLTLFAKCDAGAISPVFTLGMNLEIYDHLRGNMKIRSSRDGSYLILSMISNPDSNSMAAFRYKASTGTGESELSLKIDYAPISGLGLSGAYNLERRRRGSICHVYDLDFTWYPDCFNNAVVFGRLSGEETLKGLSNEFSKTHTGQVGVALMPDPSTDVFTRWAWKRVSKGIIESGSPTNAETWLISASVRRGLDITKYGFSDRYSMDVTCESSYYFIDAAKNRKTESAIEAGISFTDSIRLALGLKQTVCRNRAAEYKDQIKNCAYIRLGFGWATGI
ncbi:MAG: DUF11 domain-containing protein [Firmicutes bacterium]|nr:DUF11 domain-containing protein [Bacillota bacterium]